MRAAREGRRWCGLFVLVCVFGAGCSAHRVARPAPADPRLAEATALCKQVDDTYARGQYQAALPLALRALQLREAALGMEPPDVAEALVNVAVLHQALGYPATAEPPIDRAVRILERPPQAPLFIDALLTRCSLYRDQGDYARAEPCNRRALRVAEQRPGPPDEKLAAAKNNLAMLYQEQGSYAQAATYLEGALQITAGLAGDQRGLIAQMHNNLGELHRQEGRYEQAAEHHRQALRLREEALGPTHPLTGQSLNNLGELHRNRKDYAQAEAYYLRALQVYQQSLGPQHPEVGNVLNNLGVFYHFQGDFARAAERHRQALALRERALGPLHFDVASSKHNLADVLLAQGDARQGLPLLLETVLARERFSRAQAAVLSEARMTDWLRTLAAENEARYTVAKVWPEEPAARRLLLAMTLLNKGRSLEEVRGQARALRQALRTPEQRARFEELRGLRARLAELSWSPASAADPRAALQRLQDEIAAREEALAREAPGYGDRALPPPEQIIARLAERLPEDGALVEYVRYRPRRFPRPGGPLGAWEEPEYLALVLDRAQRIDLYPLGPAAAIEAAVDRQRAALTAAGDAVAAGRALYRLVFAPLAARLRGRRVLIAPDGALHLVNFSALHDGGGFLRWTPIFRPKMQMAKV